MKGTNKFDTREATNPKKNTREHYCETCGKTQVPVKGEECMECYKKELYAYASVKFGRDIKQTSLGQVQTARNESYLNAN